LAGNESVVRRDPVRAICPSTRLGHRRYDGPGCSGMRSGVRRQDTALDGRGARGASTWGARRCKMEGPSARSAGNQSADMSAHSKRETTAPTCLYTSNQWSGTTVWSAAARRRSGWARSAQGKIVECEPSQTGVSRRPLRGNPKRRHVCALQTGNQSADVSAHSKRETSTQTCLRTPNQH